MAKKVIAEGINGLLNVPPQPVQQQPEQGTNTEKKKITSLYVSERVLEYMKHIAYYDRKTVSAVAEEAILEYIKNWQPAPNPKPKKF